ncbi:hypothetical protein QU894_29465, partial [Citrobacter freundii]|uniref:hypothetical protein n=1 Tax=Citrobacter freundii TaxID=546 RepID=UPI0038BA866F
TLEEVKEHIQSFGDVKGDPEFRQAIKDYVASFNVGNLSGMSPEQLQAAFDGAEDYFSGVGESDEAEDEEDPMA